MNCFHFSVYRTPSGPKVVAILRFYYTGGLFTEVKVTDISSQWNAYKVVLIVRWSLRYKWPLRQVVLCTDFVLSLFTLWVVRRADTEPQLLASCHGFVSPKCLWAADGTPSCVEKHLQSSRGDWAAASIGHPLTVPGRDQPNLGIVASANWQEKHHVHTYTSST